MLALGILAAALAPLPLAAAKGSLQDVEREFKDAIEKVSPACVICVPSGVPPELAGSSSGVIVSRDGYVLSDGDVGHFAQVEGNRVVREGFQDEVDVRVPDLERGGFTKHPAVVVRRERGTDTTLLRIKDPPPGGFREHLPPVPSGHLRVGDFTFVMGNAFGLAEEAPPTLTAGIVASLTPLPPGDGGGTIEFVYTSAAVNPGVNGGPCVDIEGQLVGTVSTWLPAAPAEPYQFLGKIVPMDRIRAVYEDLPEAAHVFGSPPARRDRAKASQALERVFRYLARRARPAVVSLEVKRTRPLNSSVPVGPNQTMEVPRYLGPTSGVLVDGEGWIVTSLYNLTNTLELLAPGVEFPTDLRLGTGLEAIESVTVYLPDDGQAPAKVVAHDGRLGIALLKAELPPVEGTTSGRRLLEPAPRDAFEVGNLVLALGNPFGAKGNPDPLLTMGILAKQHASHSPNPWRGQWQTDAGVTDGNCGGALVDLQGRLLGVLQLWVPTRHGRNSGIGFVVPWPDVVDALPRLKEGRSLARGFLGVQWRQGATQPILSAVLPDQPAAAAGLLPGDRIVAVDGEPTPGVVDVVRRLQFRWEGEAVSLTIERDGKSIDVALTLAARP